MSETAIMLDNLMGYKDDIEKESNFSRLIEAVLGAARDIERDDATIGARIKGDGSIEVTVTTTT